LTFSEEQYASSIIEVTGIGCVRGFELYGRVYGLDGASCFAFVVLHRHRDLHYNIIMACLIDAARWKYSFCKQLRLQFTLSGMMKLTNRIGEHLQEMVPCMMQTVLFSVHFLIAHVQSSFCNHRHELQATYDDNVFKMVGSVDVAKGIWSFQSHLRQVGGARS
jgi:hypothetical protein